MLQGWEDKGFIVKYHLIPSVRKKIQNICCSKTLTAVEKHTDTTGASALQQQRLLSTINYLQKLNHGKLWAAKQ